MTGLAFRGRYARQKERWRRFSSGEEYDLEFLFGNGGRGFDLNAFDRTKLFQGTGTTTPVTAEDQVVGRVVDSSPNGTVISQSTAGSRPTYKIVSGRPVLRFDDTDDFYLIPSITLTTSLYVAAIVNQTGSPFFMEQSVTALTNDGFFFYGDQGGPWRFRRIADPNQRQEASGVAGWANGDHIIELQYTAGVGGVYRRDGVTLSNGTVTGSPLGEADTTAGLYIGSRGGTSVFSGMDLSRLIVVDGVVTAAHTAAVRAILSAQSGISVS